MCLNLIPCAGVAVSVYVFRLHLCSVCTATCSSSNLTRYVQYVKRSNPTQYYATDTLLYRTALPDMALQRAAYEKENLKLHLCNDVYEAYSASYLTTKKHMIKGTIRLVFRSQPLCILCFRDMLFIGFSF